MTSSRILLRRLERAARLLRRQGRFTATCDLYARWDAWHQRKMGTPF